MGKYNLLLIAVPRNFLIAGRARAGWDGRRPSSNTNHAKDEMGAIDHLLFPLRNLFAAKTALNGVFHTISLK
jgi:hypothetical protein